MLELERVTPFNTNCSPRLLGSASLLRLGVIRPIRASPQARFTIVQANATASPLIELVWRFKKLLSVVGSMPSLGASSFCFSPVFSICTRGSPLSGSKTQGRYRCEKAEANNMVYHSSRMDIQ